MKWQGRRQSTNVNDARGRRTGGSRGMQVGGGLSGGALILVLIITLLTGGNPLSFLGLGGEGVAAPDNNTGGSYQETPEEKERREFLSVVLAETEDTWTGIFEDMGRTYNPATLTIFSGSVQSACGTASSAVGPFYCGLDKNVYIDTDFFDQLSGELGAGGDFAMAYVLAHEIGHHIQNELGIMEQMNRAQQNASEAERNDLSVRLELQADYLAGVWGHYADRAGILEEGDIEEAMRATQAIGDDTLQKQAQGYVVPDSFTHGTSAQRTRWYLKGFKSGDLSGWDTFSAASSEDLRVLPEDFFAFLQTLAIDEGYYLAAPVYRTGP